MAENNGMVRGYYVHANGDLAIGFYGLPGKSSGEFLIMWQRRGIALLPILHAEAAGWETLYAFDDLLQELADVNIGSLKDDNTEIVDLLKHCGVVNMTEKHAEDIGLLKGSIARWEGIRDGKTAHDSADDCSLCRKYIRFDVLRSVPDNFPGVDTPTKVGNRHEQWKEAACIGCPVYLHTGNKNCRGTPVETWEREEMDLTDEDLTDDLEFKERMEEVAQDEVDFLETVLTEVQRT